MLYGGSSGLFPRFGPPICFLRVRFVFGFWAMFAKIPPGTNLELGRYILLAVLFCFQVRRNPIQIIKAFSTAAVSLFPFEHSHKWTHASPPLKLTKGALSQ